MGKLLGTSDWWVGLADFSPSPRFGKGVFRKNVGSLLEDWMIVFFAVHKLKINLWGGPLWHQAIFFNTNLFVLVGRKHMVSHSGTPRSFSEVGQCYGYKGSIPAQFSGIQLEYSKWRKTTTIFLWVRIFIKAIKHCRKHLRLIPRLIPYWTEGFLPFNRLKPRLIPYCPFNTAIVGRLIPIKQRVSFNTH